LIELLEPATDDVDSDTRAKITEVVEDGIKDVPCDQIAALVIYDLPGRDCAAKASNGELPVGSLDVYKTEYIDREYPAP
jgi:cellulose 1,4-beta-cellobiosidase